MYAHTAGGRDGGVVAIARAKEHGGSLETHWQLREEWGRYASRLTEGSNPADVLGIPAFDMMPSCCLSGLFSGTCCSSLSDFMLAGRCITFMCLGCFSI